MSDQKINITAEISEDKAAFVQELSDQALQRTLDDRDSIQRRGTFLLGGIAAVLTFGSGWLTDNWATLEVFTRCAAITELLILVVVSIPLVQCYMPSLYSGRGYDPAILIQGSFLGQPIERMMIGYSYELQRRIELNRARNTKAANNLKTIATLIFLSPLISLTLSWIFPLLVDCLHGLIAVWSAA